MYNSNICAAIATPIPFVTGPDGPIPDSVSVLWHRARCSLAFPTNFDVTEITCDGFPVDAARNKVARACLDHQPYPIEFCFFIDFDVIVPWDALTKLYFRAKTYPNYDIFAGVYCCRGLNPPDPLIYAGDGKGPFWDWKVGDILTTEHHGITGCHMGLTLIRVSLFQQMLDKGVVKSTGTYLGNNPWFLTKDTSDGILFDKTSEDMYFCNLAMQVGAKILIDTSVLADHYDKSTGKAYSLPERPKEVIESTKIAIDIGADTIRLIDGYKVYRTNINPNYKPDYVQDTRLLNLLDNTFDLVTTNNHLECFTMQEQEQVWHQLFRICKPGGRFIFVLNNLDWVLENYKDNIEEVIQRLYGEKGQYHFCYTEKIVRSMAFGIGMANIHISKLEHSIILSASKPI